MTESIGLVRYSERTNPTMAQLGKRSLEPDAA